MSTSLLSLHNKCHGHPWQLDPVVLVLAIVLASLPPTAAAVQLWGQGTLPLVVDNSLLNVPHCKQVGENKLSSNETVSFNSSTNGAGMTGKCALSFVSHRLMLLGCVKLYRLIL